MVNVDSYSASEVTTLWRYTNLLIIIITKSLEPVFQALSKGLIVLVCSEVVRQGVPDHGGVHSKCAASNSG